MREYRTGKHRSSQLAVRRGRWLAITSMSADTDAILKFPCVPGKTHIDSPGVTHLSAGPINHHWTQEPGRETLMDQSFIRRGVEQRHIAVPESRAAVDRAIGLKRICASGLADPTGLAFEPLMGKLWAAVNERNEIGPDLVPHYLTSVKENAFCSRPYS